MNGVRMFLQTRAGKIAGVLGAGFFVIIAGLGVYSFMSTKTPADAFYTTYICTETGRSFPHKNQIGETIPIHSPFSGKDTGIPGEACYWNADGSTKTDPTWVLLNESIGNHDPTFCPDCGRLVVGHNPRPGPGVNPPPTMDQYLARHPSRKPAGSSAKNDESRKDSNETPRQ